MPTWCPFNQGYPMVPRPHTQPSWHGGETWQSVKQDHGLNQVTEETAVMTGAVFTVLSGGAVSPCLSNRCREALAAGT